MKLTSPSSCMLVKTIYHASLNLFSNSHLPMRSDRRGDARLLKRDPVVNHHAAERKASVPCVRYGWRPFETIPSIITQTHQMPPRVLNLMKTPSNRHSAHNGRPHEPLQN